MTVAPKEWPCPEIKGQPLAHVTSQRIMDSATLEYQRKILRWVLVQGQALVDFPFVANAKEA